MQLINIRKIAIFRALQLGDLLCAIPAIRALRHAFPTAHITLVGLPWARQLVERFPHYLDELVEFPGYPGLPEQPVDAVRIVAFTQWMQQQGYDLALQMQGNGSIVNPMVELWNARYTAGFYRQADYRPNEWFLEYPEQSHEINRHLALMQHLGIRDVDPQLEFPVYDKDVAALQQLGLPLSPAGYVCIHPGSRGEWRQWPPALFARLGDICAQAGLAVVLTGTAAEAALTRAVQAHMLFPAMDISGQTDLGAMAVLLKNSFALIANCTGVSHMAAALRTPSLIISMDGEPHRWAPLDQQLHPTIDWTRTPDLGLAEAALNRLLQKEDSF